MLLLAAAAATAAALATGLPYGRIQPAAAGPAPAGTLRADLAAGLSAVWRIRALRALTAGTCLAFVGVGGLTTTTVLAGLKITAAACGAALVGAAAALPPPLLLLGIAAVHLAAALLYTVARPREDGPGGAASPPAPLPDARALP
ncbi:hypothetical protein [Streptomyces platensis]|uniref:hypothetical protein n=1 Tax=Streptomyces platensis TaxID=58346 RepID=UPI00379052B3